MARMTYDKNTDSYVGTHNGVVVRVSDPAMLDAMVREAAEVAAQSRAMGQDTDAATARWTLEPSEAETTDYWLRKAGG